MSESNKKLGGSAGSKTSQPKNPNAASSIQVRMNLFPLDVHQCQMFEYNVVVKPEIVNDNDKKEILDTFIAEHGLSPYLIKNNQIILQKSFPRFQGSVKYQNKSYEIILQSIQLQKDKKVQDKFAQDTEEKSENQKHNEILNSLFEKQGMIQIGRNFYEPNSKTPINPENNQSGGSIAPIASIATISGITSSVIAGPNVNSSYLELDLTSKVIHTTSIYDELNSNELNKLTKSELKESLIGRSAITQYNNRIYQISDIEWEMTTESTFLWDKQCKNAPQQVTYAHYFWEKYGIHLQHKVQPFAVSIVRGSKVYLPTEVLNLINLSDAERENYKLMNQITEKVQINPKNRVQQLEEIASNPKFQTDLKHWNIHLTPQMVKIPGRLLPPIAIQTGDSEPIELDARDNFQNQVGKLKLLEPIPLVNWVVIYDKGYIKPDEIEALIRDMQKLGLVMGIKIKSPKIYMAQSIEKFLKGYSGTENGNLIQIIMTISKGKSKPLYRAIKQECWTRLGIPSQHLSIRSLSKHKDSIIINIIEQMNVKMNGALWNIKNGHIPQDSLLVGVDVWHGGSRQGESSVAGIVTSDDQGLHYHSRTVFLNKSGQEIIGKQLSETVKERLSEYKQVHGRYPNYLIIFRDGVGESQFAEVLVKELSSIFLKPESNLPKLLVICANKRVHRKLFGIDEKNQISNPLPGTTVEGMRTQDDFENFYQVSHVTRQGTVNPTHYTIIHNTTDLSLDRIELIVYEFTHLYHNWAGGIRVPAPIEYAHKQAYQHGQLKIGQVNRRLEKNLYYI